MNVHVAIPSRKNLHCCIIIDRILNLESTSFIHRFSYNVPLHCTALGKCILAFLPPEKRGKILENIKLAGYTENTIIDIKILRSEINQIRKKGFSTDQGELHTNVYCVGAPLFQNQQLIGALSVSDSNERFSKRNLNEIAEVLIQKANFISRQL